MELQACTKIDIRPLRALKAALWDRHDLSISAQDLLHLYEDRWRYIDATLMDENEKGQLETLIATVGNGVFLGR